ncbi:MAG: hypothetical protein IKM43_00625 [Clostridia bacterium]|nr:hypothetical protein [Clostridia bacterium]MBR6778647.1 hypothetical protein [Clostridia bacterium]
MSYGETKVYFDGSHYIAIPHTTRPSKRKRIKYEEVITVQEEVKDSVENTEPSISLEVDTEEKGQMVITNEPKEVQKKQNKRQITKKELFNELYRKHIDSPRKKRKKLIIEDMLPYFEKREFCESYVQTQMERKLRNIICRRVRMVRKANLINFNYFCTFTYDDKLHDEYSFRKKLKNALSLFSSRKDWKYMGVWERAPETKRLHFHGMFKIPDGTMPGELFEHSDYNINSHKRTTTVQNSYFNERFGRSDFKKIEHRNKMSDGITYLMKYIEKTEEKIVYSKGLYQYFISDIMDEDVVCTIGQEDKKLLLFDDFNCWDEGCLIGKVSPEVIAQMRKCN